MSNRLCRLSSFLLVSFVMACATGSAPGEGEDAGGSSGAASTSGEDASSESPSADETSGGPDPLAPTWHEDIAPLVNGHCRPCHDSSEALSGIDLLNYASASGWALPMVMAVEDRSMPPWGAEATDTCTPEHSWIDDPRLSDDDIELLAAWWDSGTLEGDPELAAPLPEPPDETLEGANLELVAGSWTLPPGGEDEFRCHPVELGLNTPQWLTGLAVEATNPVVLHHAVFFYDEDCASLDLAEASGSYSCFGGPGIPEINVVGAWTPGGRPVTTPEGSGMPLAADSCVIMQAHYHPHPSREETDPGANISMRIGDEAPGLTAEVIVFGAFLPDEAPGLQPGPDDPPGGPSFIVPAGSSAHTEQLVQELEIPPGVEVRLWSALPHEHITGRSIELTLLRADPEAGEPEEECLAAVPRYDFDWQRSYAYDVPLSEAPIARNGDRLRLDCTYDNSMGNASLVALLMSEQGVATAEEVELVDMRLGDGTLDEMCVGIIGVAY